MIELLLPMCAQKRLIRHEPAVPECGESRVLFVQESRVGFAYDYRGRRVRKTVEAYDPNAGWTPAADTAYVRAPVAAADGLGRYGVLVARAGCYGFTLLLEIDLRDPNDPTGGVGVPPAGDSTGGVGIRPASRPIATWGLDLAGQNGQTGSIGVSPVNSGSIGVSPVDSGSSGVSPVDVGSIGVSPVNLEGAGTIGGLLAMQDMDDPNDPSDPNDATGRFACFYDGNGNLTQLLHLGTWDPNNPEVAIRAHYEYDPYGNIVRQTGSYAATSPWRFSTKQFDDETGLGYWGYRYYSLTLGRWVSRDPIGEKGGFNLHAYNDNSPASNLDPTGLSSSNTRTVCCIYHREAGRYLSTGYKVPMDRRCYKQIKCPVGKSAGDCCKPGCPQSYKSGPLSGLDWDHTHSYGHEGACCFCTLSVRRQSWWKGAYTHHILYLECPDFKRVIDLSPGMYRDIENESLILSELEAEPYVIATKKIPCSEGEYLRDKWEELYTTTNKNGRKIPSKFTDEYDWWDGVHCRSFAFDWFDNRTGPDTVPCK